MDRFEVAVISIDWLVVNGVLLSVLFRRRLKARAEDLTGTRRARV